MVLTLATIRDDIIRVLYEYREGLGFNELRAFFPKYERLKQALDDLIYDGLVAVKQVNVKGGKKNLHFLTERGLNYAEMHVTRLRIYERFEELLKHYNEDEKFQILGQVFKDMFEYASTLFVSGKRLDIMQGFRDAIQTPVKEFLNKPLLDDKEFIRQYFEKDERIPTGTYYDPVFLLRKFPLAFIVRDCRLALELNHALNVHHGILLALCGFLTKEEIEKRNVEWLEKHKGMTEVQIREAVLKEINTRKSLLKEFSVILTGKKGGFSLEDYGNSLSDVTLAFVKPKG